MTTMHQYQADPHSGAGNCVCGHPERAWRHPHKFVHSAIEYNNGGKQDMCTCGLPSTAACHRPAAAVSGESEKP